MHLPRVLSAAFGVDTRSLALFRVCLASVVVLDLFDRLPDLRAHYSDEGYWSRRLALQYAGDDMHLCVHMLNGSVSFAAILFIIHFLFAVMMAVGYRTRVATFLTWFMTTSLQTRNYFVGHSGDTYLRLMLFWAIFMPMDEHFSLDRIRKRHSFGRHNTHRSQHVSIGSIGALLQLVYVYTFSALEKRSRAWDIWYVQGSATFWALHSIPYFLTSFGVMMSSLSPLLLKLMTWGVLAWEVVGPFTLMSPWRTDAMRYVGVLGTFLLHFGFALCMKLEEFVWMGCTASFFALPASFWDSLLPFLSARVWRTHKRPRDLAIFYSTNYTALAQTLDAFLLLPSPTRWQCSGDEETGSGRTIEGIAVQDEITGRLLHGTDALMHVMHCSPLLWPLARARKALDACLFAYAALLDAGVVDPPSPPPSPRAKRQRQATPLRLFLRIYFSSTLWLWVVGSVSVVWVLLWNLGNVNLVQMPAALWALGQPMMLDQTWNMFAPPPRHVSWHLIELHLKSGPPMELIKAGGLFYWRALPWHTTMPEPLYANYGNHRNFKYWENYSYNSANTDARLEFGRWICREWNARHTGDEMLVTHKTHYYWTPAELSKEEQMKKVQTEIMWEHSCV